MMSIGAEVKHLVSDIGLPDTPKRSSAPRTPKTVYGLALDISHALDEWTLHK